MRYVTQALERLTEAFAYPVVIRKEENGYWLVRKHGWAVREFLGENLEEALKKVYEKYWWQKKRKRGGKEEIAA